MSDAENRSSQQLFLIGRELRRIGDNIDEEVRHRAGRRRSSYFAVVAAPGIILSTMTAIDHTAEILRRVFRFLDARRLSVVIGYIRVAASTFVCRTIRRHKDVPVI